MLSVQHKRRGRKNHLAVRALPNLLVLNVAVLHSAATPKLVIPRCARRQLHLGHAVEPLSHIWS